MRAPDPFDEPTTINRFTTPLPFGPTRNPGTDLRPGIGIVHSVIVGTCTFAVIGGLVLLLHYCHG